MLDCERVQGMEHQMAYTLSEGEAKNGLELFFLTFGACVPSSQQAGNGSQQPNDNLLLIKTEDA